MSFIAKFFLLVLLLSFGELYLLIVVAREISLLATLALCVLTGVVGGAMVRAQGLQTLTRIGKDLAKGRLPTDEIVSGLILLMIGTMLLTPGFITDTIAFLLLVPSFRRLSSGFLVAYFKKRIKMVPISGPVEDLSRNRRPEDIIIEVEPRKKD